MYIIQLQTKTNRNFNAFIYLKSLELKVPTICLVTGCVSGHRERRYSRFTAAGLHLSVPDQAICTFDFCDKFPRFSLELERT
jgi:hypothetical protein